MNRFDVTYEVTEIGNNKGIPIYQAVVTLGCIRGIQFVGVAAQSRKAAEQAAAKEAWCARAAWEGTAPLKASILQQTPKAKPPAKPQPRAKVQAKWAKPLVQQHEKDPKSQLTEFMQRYLGRACVKGDFVYERHQQGESMSYSTLTVVSWEPNLPRWSLPESKRR